MLSHPLISSLERTSPGFGQDYNKMPSTCSNKYIFSSAPVPPLYSLVQPSLTGPLRMATSTLKDGCTCHQQPAAPLFTPYMNPPPLDMQGASTPKPSIGIASSNQVQRQQRRDEPVRENTHLVLDTLASRLRSYYSIVRS